MVAILDFDDFVRLDGRKLSLGSQAGAVWMLLDDALMPANP